MNVFDLRDFATTLDVGPALAVLTRIYGLHGRTYSVTFDDDGRWSISAIATYTGKVIAKVNQRYIDEYGYEQN